MSPMQQHDAPAEPDKWAILRVAAEYAVDPRTLAKRVRGERVRGLSGVRCDRAIEALHAEKHKAPTACRRRGSVCLGL
jgi:hypothetical protein